MITHRQNLTSSRCASKSSMKFCHIKQSKLQHIVVFMLTAILERSMGCCQNQEVQPGVQTVIDIHLCVPTIKSEAFD